MTAVVILYGSAPPKKFGLCPRLSRVRAIRAVHSWLMLAREDNSVNCGLTIRESEVVTGGVM